MLKIKQLAITGGRYHTPFSADLQKMDMNLNRRMNLYYQYYPCSSTWKKLAWPMGAGFDHLRCENAYMGPGGRSIHNKYSPSRHSCLIWIDFLCTFLVLYVSPVSVSAVFHLFSRREKAVYCSPTHTSREIWSSSLHKSGGRSIQHLHTQATETLNWRLWVRRSFKR